MKIQMLAWSSSRSEKILTLGAAAVDLFDRCKKELCAEASPINK